MNENIWENEVELLYKLGQKDEMIFVQIYQKFYASILLYAEKITAGDQDIAEDATADAFIELWKGQYHFYQIGQLVNFLRKIAHNKCIVRAPIKLTT